MECGVEPLDSIIHGVICLMIRQNNEKYIEVGSTLNSDTVSNASEEIRELAECVGHHNTRDFAVEKNRTNSRDKRKENNESLRI